MAPNRREPEEWMRLTDDGSAGHPGISAYDAILDLKEALAWSEFCRYSLRAEYDAMMRLRTSDVLFVVDQRDDAENRCTELERELEEARNLYAKYRKLWAESTQ